MAAWLPPGSCAFPLADGAASYFNGLFAVGGDLSPKTMRAAYARGLFPWFNDGDPILWWHPQPRMAMLPEEFHASHSLKKELRKTAAAELKSPGQFIVRADGDFSAVVHACADAREKTWLNADMKRAYQELFDDGDAHSIEIRQDGKLIGGVFGIALGGCFFGESMFSRHRNASKIALAILCRHLVRRGFSLLDCQVPSRHLASLGAREMSRGQFMRRLGGALNAPDCKGRWQLDADILGGFFPSAKC